MFMVVLDVTVVTVALPPIGRDFHTGSDLSGVQWVADGYTVVFAGTLLSAGSIGDRLGSRAAFQTGLAFFTATSVGCALAPSLPVLVAMRLLQGVGAALVVPTSLALINASYPDKAARARAIGAWGGAGGLAAAAGPVLGGLLVAGLGWRAVFLVNLPVGLLGLALTARYVPRPRPSGAARLDLAGQLLAVMSLSAAAYGVIEAGHRGWTSPSALVAFAVLPVAVALFVRVESRRPDPMLPLGLFRSRTFSAATVVGLLLNTGFYGELFVVSFYFQQYRHFGVLAAGLAMLPQTAMVALGSLLSGRTTARTGPRLPMTAGLVIGAAGFAALLVAGAGTPYALLVLPLAATGFGTAFTMPAAVAAVSESAPSRHAGLAAGVFNAARQMGSALGVALLGALVSGAHDFRSGMRLGSLISAACFLVAALAALRTKP
jgi:DHA2 family methylenomycin A resistance protein-like MFS transporter